ncbi:NAD(P)/FAD-dependent oxidoreductase [Castellaniella defragrans]|jgi:glycine/D-amino acid oxidase-like deaminating enzyme|uniref:Glycine/D-amino acid oxidase-like deaminating enzyme n=1 Tax=Castellaniella defragrans TaxID=75697 RepID=A0A7W9TLZ6_CASDE|nr:FAD-dependent oxidoreductase [Castellaniella defragrans]KAB0608381.1 FAD-binding oxidoreductase [Castellaniella defragrans]MBB6083198.1 glycine/D-amino acid oxidase-like deaminating enzyme [Castellaniella defragrans]
MSDVIVVGAGLLGSAMAYGLARTGARVTLLDGGDQAYRASRGNFGLVWVQGKGVGKPEYARWSWGSARLWPGLARALLEETGVDVRLQQRGGLHICLSEDELAERRSRLQGIREAVGPDYEFEMLDLQAARELMPGLGPEVPGVSFSLMDGHVNPLKLLGALHAACRHRGVAILTGRHVEAIARKGADFEVRAGGERWQAARVVLAAGLANRTLAPLVGVDAPIGPNRGEVLITERLPPALAYPTNYIRQTDEGTIQIGDSLEDVGYDDSVSTPVLGGIARRAIRCLPSLAGLRLVRSWAALRVMTPDGFPIYQESASMPGAFVVSCHSGVTLAAQHVFTIAPWLGGGERPRAIDGFRADRFHSGVLMEEPLDAH